MSRTDFRKSLRVAFASCTSAGIPMKAKMIDIAKRRGTSRLSNCIVSTGREPDRSSH